jgi:soluble epoxide hydrolase/lipid-phosphate phosphatase
MAVHEIGFGEANKLPILFLHGFPELSYSWRHQLGALAQAGHGVAAPDLRGYGATGPHGSVDAYRMANLAQDVLGLLDAFGVERVVLVGHDFGGLLAWTLARDHADRVSGIVSLNTPYTRRTDQDLVETMRATRGAEHYMVRFQARGDAEALLGRDVRATFAGLMRRPKVTLEEFALLPASVRALPASLFVGEPALMGDALLSESELDVYAASFEATGFEGPLNWYRNLHRNWLDTAGTIDRVDVPALMISASHDYFLPPSTTRGMERIVRDLERRLITDCGHWTQQEQAQAVNEILAEWIGRRFGRSAPPRGPYRPSKPR